MATLPNLLKDLKKELPARYHKNAEMHLRALLKGVDPNTIYPNLLIENFTDHMMSGQAFDASARERILANSSTAAKPIAEVQSDVVRRIINDRHAIDVPDAVVPKTAKIEQAAGQIGKKWQGLHTHDKVSVAMSLGVGALCALGAAGRLGQSVGKDETGGSKIQWSNVALGIFSAAFAAASFYLAHHQLNNPTAGRA